MYLVGRRLHCLLLCKSYPPGYKVKARHSGIDQESPGYKVTSTPLHPPKPERTPVRPRFPYPKGRTREERLFADDAATLARPDDPYTLDPVFLPDPYEQYKTQRSEEEFTPDVDEGTKARFIQLEKEHLQHIRREGEERVARLPTAGPGSGQEFQASSVPKWSLQKGPNKQQRPNVQYQNIFMDEKFFTLDDRQKMERKLDEAVKDMQGEEAEEWGNSGNLTDFGKAPKGAFEDDRMWRLAHRNSKPVQPTHLSPETVLGAATPPEHKILAIIDELVLCHEGLQHPEEVPVKGGKRLGVYHDCLWHVIQAGTIAEVVQMYKKIESSGKKQPDLLPNGETYSLMLVAAAKYNEFASVERWLQLIEDKQYTLSVEAVSSVIPVFSVAGEWTKIDSLLLKSKQQFGGELPTPIMCTLLQEYVRADKWTHAEATILRLHRKTQAVLQNTDETLQCLPVLFDAYAKSGRWEHVDSLSKEWREESIQLCNGLIRVYGQGRKWEQVTDTINFVIDQNRQRLEFEKQREQQKQMQHGETPEEEEMAQRFKLLKCNSDTLCVVIETYGRHKKWDELEDALDKLQDFVELDNNSFASLIRAYGAAGLMDLVQDEWVEMQKVHDIVPSYSTYGALIYQWGLQGIRGFQQVEALFVESKKQTAKDNKTDAVPTTEMSVGLLHSLAAVGDVPKLDRIYSTMLHNKRLHPYLLQQVCVGLCRGLQVGRASEVLSELQGIMDVLPYNIQKRLLLLACFSDATSYQDIFKLTENLTEQANASLENATHMIESKQEEAECEQTTNTHKIVRELESWVSSLQFLQFVIEHRDVDDWATIETQMQEKYPSIQPVILPCALSVLFDDHENADKMHRILKQYHECLMRDATNGKQSVIPQPNSLLEQNGIGLGYEPPPEWHIDAILYSLLSLARAEQFDLIEKYVTPAARLDGYQPPVLIWAEIQAQPEFTRNVGGCVRLLHTRRDWCETTESKTSKLRAKMLATGGGLAGKKEIGLLDALPWL